MKSKAKHTNPAIELVLCIFLGYLGVHRFYAGKTKSAVAYLLTLGLCGVGWIYDIVVLTMRIVKARKPVSIEASGAASTVLNPSSHKMTYHYDDVKFYPPNDMVSKIDRELLRPGTEIRFVAEPDNEYDDRAVALYVGDSQIGYLLRNRLQDMTNDYLAKGWPVKATLSSLKKVDGEYQGYISLSFYRPLCD